MKEYRKFNLPEEVSSSLTSICEALSPDEFAWRVAGTGSLVIRGADIEIGDIDVEVRDTEVVGMFKNAFSNCYACYNEVKKADVFNFGAKELEVYHYDFKDYKDLDVGIVNSHRVRLIPLSRLYSLYEGYNRPKKMALVKSLMLD